MRQIKPIFSLVIEISPYEFAKEEYPTPNVSKYEAPEAWTAYWKYCLGDANLVDIEPICAGSYHVYLSELLDKNLSIILDKQLQEPDLVLFYGGVVLLEEHNLIIEPQCCADLKNHEDWNHFFAEKPKSWELIWIGHPWIYGRFKDGLFQITTYTEEPTEAIKDSDIKYCFTLTDAELALDNLLQQVELQELRFSKVLSENLSYKEAKQYAYTVFHEPHQ